MFGWLKGRAAPTFRWVGTRACSCGSHRFRMTIIEDMVQCSGCGLLYSVSAGVEKPIAKLVRVEDSTDRAPS